MHKDINFNKMKEKLHDQGYLYQYRPCSISETTIYDLDNIRNEVLYARSPIHMNDPFDSTFAFDEMEIVDEIIDACLDYFEIEEHIKLLLSLLIKSRFLNTFPQLINNLLMIKKKLKILIVSKKWNKELDYKTLYQSYSKIIVDYINKDSKEKYNEMEIFGIVTLLDVLGDNEITEQNILNIKGFNEILVGSEVKLKEFRENEFKKAISNFQRKITVTCLSASGWDNHLMWSHYTNSYKGICIEYDFTKLKNDIGLIDKVVYNKNRPLIKVKDLFGGKIILRQNDDGKIVLDDNNIADESYLISFLLKKQDIWNYEKEWRIVNAEEKSDTFRFIPVPFIKSITFGPKIDLICKYMLVDICKEKNIDLYELVPSTVDYSLNRILINKEELNWTLDEQLNFIKFLFKDFEIIGPQIEEQSKELKIQLDNKEYDWLLIKQLFRNCLKLLSESFFAKKIIINLIKLNNIDLNDKDNIETNIDEINMFASDMKINAESFKENVEILYKNEDIQYNEYLTVKKILNDIINVSNKILFQ